MGRTVVVAGVLRGEPGAGRAEFRRNDYGKRPVDGWAQHLAVTYHLKGCASMTQPASDPRLLFAEVSDAHFCRRRGATPAELEATRART